MIIPVHANAPTLRELKGRLERTLAGTGSDLQIIFVNDFSPDASDQILASMAAADPAVRVIELDRNLGQQNAIREGLRAAEGEILIVLDADLQDPPEAIPELIDELRARPADAVFASRAGVYQSWHRMLCSWLFRWAVRKLTGLPKGAGSYVALSKRMAAFLMSDGNRRFYLAGLIGCSGYPISAVTVTRHRRMKGQSAYTETMRFLAALSNLACVLSHRMNSWR